MIFKDNYDFETRKSESNKILNKYPSRIPVIVNKSEDCILDDIDKKTVNLHENLLSLNQKEIYKLLSNSISKRNKWN